MCRGTALHPNKRQKQTYFTHALGQRWESLLRVTNTLNEKRTRARLASIAVQSIKRSLQTKRNQRPGKSLYLRAKRKQRQGKHLHPRAKKSHSPDKSLWLGRSLRQGRLDFNSQKYLQYIAANHPKKPLLTAKDLGAEYHRFSLVWQDRDSRYNFKPITFKLLC